jgi:predicted nucleotidyltransferase
MTEKDKKILNKIKSMIPPDLKEKIKMLIVFGSRVKGEETEDSDLDILAIVDERSKELEQRLDDIMYQVMWENDFKPIISFKVFSYDKYTKALQEGYSFYKRVNSEGISIWK